MLNLLKYVKQRPTLKRAQKLVGSGEAFDVQLILAK